MCELWREIRKFELENFEISTFHLRIFTINYPKPQQVKIFHKNETNKRLNNNKKYKI